MPNDFETSRRANNKPQCNDNKIPLKYYTFSESILFAQRGRSEWSAYRPDSLHRDNLLAISPLRSAGKLPMPSNDIAQIHCVTVQSGQIESFLRLSVVWLWRLFRYEKLLMNHEFEGIVFGDKITPKKEWLDSKITLQCHSWIAVLCQRGSITYILTFILSQLYGVMVCM